MRESFLDLDCIYPKTKVEVKSFNQIFCLTLSQLRKLYLDPFEEWNSKEFARKFVETAPSDIDVGRQYLR